MVGGLTKLIIYLYNLTILVQDDTKLLDDDAEVPNPNKVIDGWSPGREIVTLLDGN